MLSSPGLLFLEFLVKHHDLKTGNLYVMLFTCVSLIFIRVSVLFSGRVKFDVEDFN